MATILNAYDLSGGETTSLEVANPNNVRLHLVWGGTRAGNVKITWMVKDGSSNYVPLKLEGDKIAEYFVTTSNTEQSDSIIGINSSSLVIKVIPSSNATGTLTAYTYES